MDVLLRLGRTDAGFYPDYDAAVGAVAAALDVRPDQVLLTNGLDEGILAAAGAALRDRTTAVPEALGVMPAFDMYETFVTALGGRMVTVPMDDGFRFPGDGLRAAVTPATRIVFVTNPHNPSGVAVAQHEILELAQAIAPVWLFADEAYADFSGETVIDRERLRTVPNLIVGRTFSKGYGLAGLRVGALVGHPETLAPMRPIVPPYSLNAWATAAIPAAAADTAYRDAYVHESTESRRLLTAMCERLGLQTWPSRANFLLVRVGPQAPALVAALEARGIRVRDRSHEAGCEGCIRVTAGRISDTERLIPLFEEALCAAR
jgi:histidinol-phosphate aminotransferase